MTNKEKFAKQGSEHIEQVKVVQYCKVRKIPIYSNMNGIYLPLPKFIPAKYRTLLQRSIQTVIRKLRAEGGFQNGLPDVTVPVQNKNYGALYIELKIGYNKASEDQIAYMKMLSTHGNFCCVCNGADETIETIEKYLKNEL